MQTLLLDTYSLFFRSFYALPHMNTREGLVTNALYGFSSLLLKLLRERGPCAVALANDLPEPTFRHYAYAAYKAKRPPLPDALKSQLTLLVQLTDALGFPALSAAGYEADDVIATLCLRLAERGDDVVVVSGDRDLLQLVNDRVTVLFVGRRSAAAVQYDRAAVEARFGISPERLPTYVALTGDTADNIPKVPRVGPRTARALCAKYGDTESLLAGLSEITPERLRGVLADHQAQIRQSAWLATLRTDVPLPQVWPKAFDAAAKVRTRHLFEHWEFKSLFSRLEALPTEAN